jgi:hypothetical protein
LPSFLVSPRDALEVRVARKADDFGLVVQLDGRIFFDALNEIARHRIRQLASAYEHVDLARRLRKKNSRLSRGVAATDNRHVLSFTELRFHEGRAVVNSLAFEFIQIAERRLVVLCAGGYDDGARRETVPVVQNQLEGRLAHSNRTTRCATIILAPNFSACTIARVASSWPEIPVGKPR